jgi:hypothetical protein
MNPRKEKYNGKHKWEDGYQKGLNFLSAPFSRFTALAPRLSSFLGGEFVSGALFMGGFSAFAGDVPLFFRIHGCESAFAFDHDNALLPTP